MSKESYFKWSFWLLLSIFWYGCYESTEGCIDVLASNYNANVDNDCEACCSYPNLIFSFDHYFDTIPYHADSVWTDANGEAYRLSYFNYFISDGFISDESGNKSMLLDTLTLSCLLDGSETVVLTDNNYNIVNRKIETNTMGSMRIDGLINSAGIFIGLSECYNHADTELLRSSNLLSSADSLRISQETGFKFAEFGIQTDTSDSAISKFAWSGDHSLIAIESVLDSFITRGSDFKVEIEVDFQQWLKDIQFSIGDSTTISNQIFNNTQNAFKVL